MLRLCLVVRRKLIAQLVRTTRLLQILIRSANIDELLAFVAQGLLRYVDVVILARQNIFVHLVTARLVNVVHAEQLLLSRLLATWASRLLRGQGMVFACRDGV